MSEAVLTVLKFCFLALLYLFLYRVVRLTLRELRAPALTAEPAGVPPAAPPRRERRPQAPPALRPRIVEPPPRPGGTAAVDPRGTPGRRGGGGPRVHQHARRPPPRPPVLSA